MKQLFLGTMQESLLELEDNSVDSVVTDPPYGIDFMGKKWDYDVPSVEMWEEVFRVLKPGGHLLSFSSARTYHRMTVAIEDAGFEIRDQVMWVYGSGFPKSHNIGKAVDKKLGNKRGEVEITKGTSEWEGWGTALKPAHEPICVARKPISEKTVVDNVLKWGVGGLNIDKSRVTNNGETFNTDAMLNKKDSPYGVISAREGNGGFIKVSSLKAGGNAEALQKLQDQGRFPANFIHDGSQGVLDLFPETTKTTKRANKASSSTGEDFSGTWNGSNSGFKKGIQEAPRTYDGEGSAARFFYVPKVSKKERNEGLEGKVEATRKAAGDFRPSYDQDGSSGTAYGRWGEALNTHPTVKPITLMEYLITMVTPTGGIVLDPFMGSGSTGCAARKNGYGFIGCEMEEHSYEVAKARIEHWELDT